MKAIVNGTILTPDEEISGKALLYDETVLGIVSPEESRSAAAEVTDAEGLYVAPGLVDTHIHGYGGADTSDGDPEGIRRMAGRLVENGVTSFLPTTLTVAWQRLEAICAGARGLREESRKPDFPGAEILGIHLEGPFINPARKGAQNPDYILAPDAARILPLADIIRVVTLAPEMPGGEACIRALREKTDIAVSMGHSDASFEQAMAGIAQGVTRATHLFNAMTQMINRKLGVVGAALLSDVYTELIADTFHVSRELFPLLCRVKGDRLVLITDALRAAGMPDGEYENGGQRFTLKGIECRLPDGTIAGSVLRLNEGVRNLRDYGGIPLSRAVRAASLSAAESVGLAGRKGSLEPGKDADIVLMDGDCRVRMTIVRGQIKYACR